MSYPPPPSYQQPTGRLRGRIPRLLGWIFLALAIVLFVIGGVVIATKSLGKVNDFHRVSFSSGSGTVDLNGTGKWIGYYEASDVTNSITRIPAFRAEVTSPSGQTVSLRTFGNRTDGKVKKFTYDYNGHKGVGAFEFTAPAAGRYAVRLQAVDALPSGADVAIGRDIEGGTIAGALLIVGGVISLIAAIVLLIVGFVKRGRHKRELQQAQYGYGAPPPGYGQPAFGTPGGYGGQPPGYGEQPPGYGGQPPGYGPPPAYGEQPPGYGEQPPPSRS
jgi:hypothetical protein